MAKENQKFESKKEAPAPKMEAAPKMEVKKKKLVMRTNVLFNHTHYLKDSDVPAEHEAFFVKEGFTIEV